jgi:hypothetical protein
VPAEDPTIAELLKPDEKVKRSCPAMVVLAVQLPAQKEYADQILRAPPPAQDALNQGVGLTSIVSFQYVDEMMLDVEDGQGRHFKMEIGRAHV